MSAKGWRLTSCLLPTKSRITRVVVRVGKLIVEDVTALIQPFFPYVDIKNFTA